MNFASLQSYCKHAIGSSMFKTRLKAILMIWLLTSPLLW